MEISESKMKELSVMASALADAYYAGELSPKKRRNLKLSRNGSVSL
jgi:hypothetical protein